MDQSYLGETSIDTKRGMCSGNKGHYSKKMPYTTVSKGIDMMADVPEDVLICFGE